MIFLLVGGLLAANYANARAKIPVCIPCEYIETVKDLPSDTEFIGEFNDPLNIGYKYEQFNIIWIPMWNKAGEYCLVNEAEDTYYDLTPAEIEYLKKEYPDISFEGSPLGLWDKMGGKAIVIGLVALYFLLGRKYDDDDASTSTNASTPTQG